MDPTLAANEARLLADFQPVQDPHERLALITAACAGPGLPEAERREADLVLGCVSQVWLCGEISDGLLHLRWDSASPLVRGLVGLICHAYQGTQACEISLHRCTLLTQLGLNHQLSPTRLRGLASAESRIHDLAAG